MMKGNSLTRRLAVGAAALIAFSLFGAGQLLVLMFRDHVEQRFDHSLVDHLDELVAASEVGTAGHLVLAWTTFEPRFHRPGSGWYWQVARNSAVDAASQSLAGMRLDLPPVESQAVHEIEGPAGQALRVLVRHITLPGARGDFVYAVAGPVSEIRGDVWRFSVITAATLAVLGVGLVLAMLFQVRYGLRPLKGLRSALADIRSGRRHRMPESFPSEVEPVVDELNALLDHNAALLARARTHAGDLAHALKHPLMVLAHEAREAGGEKGRAIAEQVTAMRGAVERNLARARVAGPGGPTGMRAPVAEAFEGLRYSLDLLYQDRGLRIEAKGLDGLSFAGDGQDLEEMLGNLMDNACKWGRSRIRVAASRRNGRLSIAVEDDGEGVAEEERAAVMARGGRLDERVVGAGLGLGIVSDIAEIYNGSLRLADSELGGLKAELSLPSGE